ncbi:MAG: chemotaxis protein CheX [Deltaproteobacteria bacterium]|nr:chemotaxis protein CheX [Deltaproteobacteria bacterium]MBN2670533.1 chemotaxis protein CheX [Deltaproteobacteria bacterium]
MSEYPSINDWMDAVVVSSDELATTMLGMSGSELIRTHNGLPKEGNAAYISVVGEQSAVQIGVGATPENCQILVKALMGMEPDEEDLEPDEMTDAFSEITNILAGQVKTVIGKRSEIKVNLGIPMFIKGELHVPESSEVQVAEAKIGDVPVTFLVMKNADKKA